MDLSTEKIFDFFLQAAELDMIGEYLNYVITNLDTHTIDFHRLTDYNVNYTVQANITSMRLINTTSHQLNNAVNDWKQGERNMGRVYSVPDEFTPVFNIHDMIYFL